jgi:hypothetical protein
MQPSDDVRGAAAPPASARETSARVERLDVTGAIWPGTLDDRTT